MGAQQTSEVKTLARAWHMARGIAAAQADPRRAITYRARRGGRARLRDDCQISRAARIIQEEMREKMCAVC